MIIIIFFASGSSMDLDLPRFPMKDKLVHFLLFGLVATLILRVSYDPRRPWRSGLIAILITSLYGVADEFRQSFTPGREVDVMDWAADSLGALVAATVYIHVPFWRKFLERTFWERAKKPANGR
jgi:VanZ family protein